MYPVRRILCGLLTFASVASVPLHAQPIYADSIIAVVNEEVITVYDVASYTHFMEQELRKYYGQSGVTEADKKEYADKVASLRREAAERLIDMEVMHAEFVRQGYQVPNDAVDKRVDRYVADRTNSDYQKFEEELAKDSLTMKAFREQIRKSIAVEMLERSVLDSRISVTPSEIDAYYAEHTREFAPPTRVKLTLIQLSQNEGESVAAFEARCQILQKDIAADGSNFSELATTYSTSASAKKGGDLGWIEQADLRADFRNAFASITSGSISNWVFSGEAGKKTGFLLRVEDVETGTPAPLTDELRTRIRNSLFSRQRDKMRKEMAAKLRSQAYIRTFFD